MISQKFQKRCLNAYLFGFQGKEKLDEVYGDANAYDFGARIYDPRIARWLAVDPLAVKYSFVSPYQFVNNCPLKLIDPNGKEWVNGYDAEVASLGKQLIDNPNDRKLKSDYRKALANQSVVNEMVSTIKENDISLYNYVDQLQVKDFSTGEKINVKVTVKIDEPYNHPDEAAGTSYNNQNSKGVTTLVGYDALEQEAATHKKIEAPINSKDEIGFDVTIYQHYTDPDSHLANEIGDVMHRMEYPNAARKSGPDPGKPDNGISGGYLEPGSSGDYSKNVQEMYRQRKKSGEGKNPNNNPYPVKKKS